MNDEMLSALVDGECDPSELDEILDEFSKDPQLRQRYSRLRMARDSRRGVLVTAPDFTFADRVMIRLEREGASAPATVEVQVERVRVATESVADAGAPLPAVTPLLH